jgi:hypothetical protein
MYFQAYNNAGLYSSASSWGAIVDSSPPVIGVVHDGGPTDLDYQTDRYVLNAWWQGFDDPHSGISHYRWMIGTCVGCDDVLPGQFVGQETSKWFEEGYRKAYNHTAHFASIPNACISGWR